jgi:hypothetical protein
MAFSKGNNLSTGRPKGSSNKISKMIRENLALIIENQLETIEADLKRLSPEIRLRSLSTLMRFVLPTLKEVSNESNENFTPISIDFKDIIRGFNTIETVAQIDEP